MASYPNPINFRLNEQQSQRLREEAQKYEQSSGEYARRVVLDSLEDTERKRLRDALQMFQEEIGRLRSDIEAMQPEGTNSIMEVRGLRAEVVALRSELGDLRKDLATAVRALLVGAGRVSKDDAQTWTTKNLVK
ncbi:MAG: hypothetical protein NT023_05810 [Armatimonadetes bacterium]|nr:hypothetical protein [Armatimonadota bacterium]